VFGPAGAVLHLPWLPAWFIEGLAEALTVSIGSDVQAGIERHHALAKTWPTYDQLFVPYGGNNLSTTTYAISGAFISWVLRKKSINFLPVLLEDFYRYTFPDYVLWSMIPSNSFMPFDAALHNHLGKDGRALYEEYKRAAEQQWQSKKRGTFFSADAKPRLLTEQFYHLHRSHDDAVVMEKTSNSFVERPLIFDPHSGWAVKLGPARSELPSHSALPVFAWDQDEVVSVGRRINLLSGERRHRLVRGGQTITPISGQAQGKK
jgi:hypothetical protein